MIYIGIDPGVSGCVAVVDADGQPIAMHGTPTTRGKRGEDYLPAEMLQILRSIERPAVCVIESVSVRPLESPSTGQKVGYGFGLWIGMLAALAIPYSTALPAVWKKHFSILDSKLTDVEKKRLARARAQEIFPSVAVELGKRRPDYSEAILLAEYARRTWRSGGTR